MSVASNRSAPAKWHFRIIGSFWTLFGIVSTVHVCVHYYDDLIDGTPVPLLLLLLTTASGVAGCGIYRPHAWAKLLIAIVAGLITLWSLDMLFLLTFRANFRMGFWLAIALIFFCSYTGVILVLYRKAREGVGS